MAKQTLKVGSTVKEVEWMGQFARNEVLTVVEIDGDSVLLSDPEGYQLWDDVSNVAVVDC
ncbi:hypothetical protein DEEACLCL_00194 [Salmonella phage CRW-SP2]|nr:hypothetical protein DEEACLCL_00194 [Salmonella phage CRW-SP2]